MMNLVKRSSRFDLFGVVLLAGFHCLTAGAQQVDPAIYQRVVDENITLRQEQSRLTKENSDLRRKNADLILEIQDLESKREQLAMLVAQLKTPEENKAEKERLLAERAALKSELERVRQSLAAVVPVVTNSPPPLPTPEQGSSLFRKIEQENADLRQQLAVEREALQGKTKSHDSLIAQVSEQRGQVERLSREMKDLKQDSRQVKAREAALRKALDKVARQSFQQQEEIARLQAEKAKVEGEKAQGSVPPLTGVAPLGQPKTKAESSESSDDTEGMLLAAQKALRAKRVREAEGLYEEALKKAPRNPSVHYNLGVLYADYLKNPDKAAQCFRKYLDLAPAARDAPLVRSWLLELDARTGR